MISTNIRLALTSMRSARIRTLLTLMGIIIGVASVVLTVSLGEGITSQTLRQVENNTRAQVVVIPGVPIEREPDGSVRGINLSGLVGASSITEKDIQDISSIEGVGAVVPFAIISASPTTPSKGQLPGVFVAATTPEAESVLQKEVISGSFFDEDEVNRNLAVIGRDVAIAYFEDDEPIGRSLSIRGSEFIVRGVFDSFERSGIQLGLNFNSAILIPSEAGKRISAGVLDIREVRITAADSKNPTELANQIESKLLSNHSGQKDFSVFEKAEFLSIANQLFDMITIFVSAIAGISLFVGGIGIMNIMLVSVTERTREIGIRKALGASNRQILVQFLTEAIVLCLFGGFLGVGIAVLIGGGISLFTDIAPSFSIRVVSIGFLLSLIVGVLFGVTPALKAARKDPIESLRHD